MSAVSKSGPKFMEQTVQFQVPLRQPVAVSITLLNSGKLTAEQGKEFQKLCLGVDKVFKSLDEQQPKESKKIEHLLDEKSVVRKQVVFLEETKEAVKPKADAPAASSGGVFARLRARLFQKSEPEFFAPVESEIDSNDSGFLSADELAARDSDKFKSVDVVVRKHIETFHGKNNIDVIYKTPDSAPLAFLSETKANSKIREKVAKLQINLDKKSNEFLALQTKDAASRTILKNFAEACKAADASLVKDLKKLYGKDPSVVKTINAFKEARADLHKELLTGVKEVLDGTRAADLQEVMSKATAKIVNMNLRLKILMNPAVGALKDTLTRFQEESAAKPAAFIEKFKTANDAAVGQVLAKFASARQKVDAVIVAKLEPLVVPGDVQDAMALRGDVQDKVALLKDFVEQRNRLDKDTETAVESVLDNNPVDVERLQNELNAIYGSIRRRSEEFFNSMMS